MSLVLLRKGADVEALDSVLAQNPDLSYINVLARTGRALKAQRESSARLIVLAFALAGALLVFVYRDRRAFLLVSVPRCPALLRLAYCSAWGVRLICFMS